MWNSCLDFITKEIWSTFTGIEASVLSRLGHIRGQSQVGLLSKTEDIAELK